MIYVDRIEEGIAVLEEDGRWFHLPVNTLPEGTKEGSLLVRTENGFALDPETEKKLRAEMAERTRRLFGKK